MRTQFQQVSPISRFIFVATIVPFFLADSPISATTIPHGTVDLVAENQWISPGRTVNLGLHFQLEKGWHIYWVNPGDSGEPPRVTWQLPKGLSASDILWPAPNRLGSPTVVDFGYEGETTLIVPMRAAPTMKAEEVAQISADLKVLVCREICIPGKSHVSLALPIKVDVPPADPRSHDHFEAARKALPKAAPGNWKITVRDAADSFVLIGSVGREIHQASFFPLLESQIENSAPQKLKPNSTGFELTLMKSDQLLKPIDRLKGVLEISATESYILDTQVDNAAPLKK